jgi:hypothetical protein
MLFDIPFIADWQKIGEHRQQLTDLNNAHEGVVHAYADQRVMPPNLIIRRFTLLKIKLWFITLPYS